MITKVRKYGDAGPFASIEHEPGECACCEAARSIDWSGGAGVAFLEEEGGPIRRVENLGLEWPLAFFCGEVTADEVRAELADGTIETSKKGEG